MNSLSTHLCRCSCEDAIYARELAHRTASVLQQAMAAVHLAKRNGPGQLETAMARLSAAAELHKELDRAAPGIVDGADSLRRTCWAALKSAGAHDDLELDIDLETVMVDSGAVRPMLMIAAELVANSARHAFADGCGHIRVALKDDGHTTELLVADDGVCAGWRRPGGQGNGIVDDLAAAMGGAVDRQLSAHGSSRIIVRVHSLAAALAGPAGTA